MAKAQTFNANPAVLVWARERWGLEVEQAAAELKIAPAQLERIERGQEPPTVALLRGMTKKYNISLTSLILAEPPPVSDRPQDFRTEGGAEPVFSTKVTRAIILTHVNRTTATDLANDLEEPIGPDLPQTALDCDIEALAGEHRRLLNVTDAEQLKWGDARASFRHWRAQIEALGILVFLHPLPREDCRGFSLAGDKLMPAIVVSSLELPQAQTFTLLHEYAHLLLRRPGVCDEQERPAHRRPERFCNQFAAAALMPRSIVESTIAKLSLPTGAAWEIDDIARLAQRLRVSQPAAALRLGELQIAAAQLFRKLGLHRDLDVWRDENPVERKPVAIPHARMRLNRLGSRYVGLVLASVDGGLIDDIDADYCLDLKIKHHEALRNLLANEAGLSRASA